MPPRSPWSATPSRLLSGSCSSARSFAPRFLPTLGRPHAVALRFARCDQLATGLSPTRVRPCWAHQKPAGGPVGSLLRLINADWFGAFLPNVERCASLLALRLPLSTMRVFAIGIEHPLAVATLSHTDPRVHRCECWECWSKTDPCRRRVDTL